jgi:hypothetical protein
MLRVKKVIFAREYFIGVLSLSLLKSFIMIKFLGQRLDLCKPNSFLNLFFLQYFLDGAEPFYYIEMNLLLGLSTQYLSISGEPILSSKNNI